MWLAYTQIAPIQSGATPNLGLVLYFPRSTRSGERQDSQCCLLAERSEFSFIPYANNQRLLMYAQDFLVMAPTYFAPRRQIVFWRVRAGALRGVGEVERLDRSPDAESFRYIELPALHYSLKTFPSPKARILQPEYHECSS